MLVINIFNYFAEAPLKRFLSLTGFMNNNILHTDCRTQAKCHPAYYFIFRTGVGIAPISAMRKLISIGTICIVLHLHFQYTSPPGRISYGKDESYCF